MIGGDFLHVKAEQEIKTADDEQDGSGRHKGADHDLVSHRLNHHDGVGPHGEFFDPGFPKVLKPVDIKFISLMAKHPGKKQLIPENS